MHAPATREKPVYSGNRPWEGSLTQSRDAWTLQWRDGTLCRGFETERGNLPREERVVSRVGFEPTTL